MWSLTLLLTCLVLASLRADAAPSDVVLRELNSRRTPLKPTDDPFYVGPAGFEAESPGAILRHRRVPAPIMLSNNGTLKVKAAYQVLFRTSDSTGQPQAAMTTLLVPDKPDYKKLLSYQIAYDSSYINCNPSYTLQQGSDSSNGTTTSAAETLLIKAALDQGWIVNTPDYEGDRAAFVSGPQAGQATLDSVRAVLASGAFTGVSRQARYAMWGYSGGCLATGWASELQPSYARELKFEGAACGGLVPNVTSIIYSINGTSFAGLGPAGTMGLAQGYQNLSRYIDAHLVPSTAAKFKSVLTQCQSEDSSKFENEDLFKYFTNGQRAIHDPLPKSVLQLAGQQGLRDVPTMPLYYYKSAGDQVSKVQDTDSLYRKLCKRGARIHYARDALGEHVSEAILGAPGALGWLKDRLNGMSVPKGCSKELVAVSTLSPDSVEVLGPFVYSALLAELGDPSAFPG